MEEKKSKSGRKRIPTKQKVAPVTAYISGAHIESIGGIEAARIISLTALEKAKKVKQ